MTEELPFDSREFSALCAAAEIDEQQLREALLDPLALFAHISPEEFAKFQQMLERMQQLQVAIGACLARYASYARGFLDARATIGSDT